MLACRSRHVCYSNVCFQAEDGIRDLVRSRGLGDVYKRQTEGSVMVQTDTKGRIVIVEDEAVIAMDLEERLRSNGYEVPVSYTHLTLPTSDLV